VVALRAHELVTTVWLFVSVVTRFFLRHHSRIWIEKYTAAAMRSLQAAVVVAAVVVEEGGGRREEGGRRREEGGGRREAGRSLRGHHNAMRDIGGGSLCPI
jgi:hypothetical protein